MGNSAVSAGAVSQTEKDLSLGEVYILEDPVTESEGESGWNEQQYHAVYMVASGQQCFEQWVSVPRANQTGTAYDAINAFFDAEVQAQRKNAMR